MSAKGALVRGLVSVFFFSVLVTFIFIPQVAISPLVSVLFIVAVESSAIALSWWLAAWGAAQTFIRTLIMALIMAAALTFYFNPVNNLGFDNTFIVVFIVEMVAITVSWFLTREPSSKGKQGRKK